MKITIYELLGLVKDGKAPKKIKFRNEIYEYENHIKDGFIDYVGIEKENDEAFYLSSYIGNNYISDIFTDEVEIIEELKKIEKEDLFKLDERMSKASLVAWQKANNGILKKKINELIDENNNLKEK